MGTWQIKNNKFKVLSVNVRGAADEVKRKALFKQHRFNSNILIMQETHSNTECEKIWEAEWGGKIIFSHGTNQSRGIAAFIDKATYAKVENIFTGDDGRTLIFDLKENGRIVTFVAIYAPNEDNPRYFESLREKLKERSENKILIGDFNLTLDVDMDRYNTYNNNNRAKAVVEEIMEEFYLNDVWRIRNPEKREYSWRKSGQTQKASRIDLALTSQGMDQWIEYTTYLSSIKTDHRALYLCLQLSDIERGKGYWKFNNQLLKDKEFLEYMSKEILITLEASKEKPASKKWEILKERIKKSTRKYSRKKASEDNLIIEQLSEIVNEYEANFPLNKEEDKLLLETKTDLEEKIIEKTQGAMFRSKVRWQEEGETSSKYFFSLEKARYNAKTCYKIIDEGNNKEITDPVKILDKQRQFYQNLYEEDAEVEFTMENTENIYVPEQIRKQQEEQIELKRTRRGYH